LSHLPIAVGDLVRLRYAPFGKPGKVLEICRGRLVVRWDDLDLTTRHAEGSLIAAPGSNNGICPPNADSSGNTPWNAKHPCNPPAPMLARARALETDSHTTANGGCAGWGHDAAKRDMSGGNR
jgi:hypothetical protein